MTDLDSRGPLLFFSTSDWQPLTFVLERRTVGGRGAVVLASPESMVFVKRIVDRINCHLSNFLRPGPHSTRRHPALAHTPTRRSADRTLEQTPPQWDLLRHACGFKLANKGVEQALNLTFDMQQWERYSTLSKARFAGLRTLGAEVR